MEVTLTIAPLPPDIIADTIEWFVDDVFVGSGESIDTFVPLSTHRITVIVTTTEAESLTGLSQIEIVDTTKPEITLLLAGPNGQPATSRTRNITVHFDALDLCDPAPLTMATGGAQIVDGETIRIRPNNGSITVPGDNFTVTVTATDGSDNTAVEEVVLPLAP